jgi:RimJ/RimL family protein N-acetyltransferase
MRVLSMNKEIADIISNWSYELPYSLYSFDGSYECVREFLNGYYFYVVSDFGELMGFVCYRDSACVPAGFSVGAYDRKDLMDIGLGMRPDLCGQGKGLRLLNAGMDFGKNFYGMEKFRLTVATFNKRAIRVYEKAGFLKGTIFLNKSDIGTIEFQTMIRE